MGSYPPGTTYGHLVSAGIIVLCAYCGREILEEPLFVDDENGYDVIPYHPLCAAQYAQDMDLPGAFETAYTTAMDVVSDMLHAPHADRQQKKQAEEALQRVIKNLRNLLDVVTQAKTRPPLIAREAKLDDTPTNQKYPQTKNTEDA